MAGNRIYWAVFQKISVMGNSDPSVKCELGDGWKYVGKTFAVSEKQAVNNVRFRIRGRRRPYPFSVGGECGTTFFEEWKANPYYRKDRALAALGDELGGD